MKCCDPCHPSVLRETYNFGLVATFLSCLCIIWDAGRLKFYHLSQIAEWQSLLGYLSLSTTLTIFRTSFAAFVWFTFTSTCGISPTIFVCLAHFTILHLLKIGFSLRQCCMEGFVRCWWYISSALVGSGSPLQFINNMLHLFHTLSVLRL